jgi:cytosine/adenosine deaminase-related metal-dependent hydrolase
MNAMHVRGRLAGLAAAFFFLLIAITARVALADIARDCTMRAGNANLLIRAIVLARDGVLPHGEVLISGGTIACVGTDCSAQAAGATLLACPQEVLSPGLINTHDHIGFAGVAPRPDTGERFEHRHEWRLGLDGHHKTQDFDIDTDPRVIGWGELRFLAGGTTSTVGGSMAPGLVRNLDFAAGLEGLPAPPVTYRVFPLDDAAGIMRTSDCDYGPHAATHDDVAKTSAFLAHVAEGRDDAARNEFRCESSATYDVTPLPAGGGVSNDWIMPQATLIHAVGLTAADLALVAQRHAALVWSPRSNLALYGATLDVLDAHRLGITIALGSDWLPSGSMNLNRELICAKHYDRAHLRDALSDEDLWKMVTIDAARVVHDETWIGSIAPQMVADVALFKPHGPNPFSAIVQSSPQNVSLVVRGGTVLYGDPRVVDALHPGCETIDAGGAMKRLCGEAGRPTAAALEAFAGTRGLYPLAFAGVPKNEPLCEVRP